MNLVAQLFVVLTIVAFNAYVIHILRKEMIEYQYALTWLFAGMAMLVIAAFPQILWTISTFIGIAIPLNLLYFLAILLGFFLTFQIMINISRMRRHIYELIQEVSILKKQVEAQKTPVADQGHPVADSTEETN
jgi:hypothetical protein